MRGFFHCLSDDDLEPGVTLSPDTTAAMERLAQRVEALEARDRADSDAWTGVRRANSELRTRVEALEAWDAEQLRTARRPKPPSLKEQALEGLSRIESGNEFFSDGMKDLATIRQALEALSDD